MENESGQTISVWMATAPEIATEGTILPHQQMLFRPSHERRHPALGISKRFCGSCGSN